MIYKFSQRDMGHGQGYPAMLGGLQADGAPDPARGCYTSGLGGHYTGHPPQENCRESGGLPP